MEIREEWIRRTVSQPESEMIREDGRIRRWTGIAEAENRYLRVVVLQDGETVHNAFFDRGFKHTLLELDAAGNICAITMEHTKERADIPAFSFEQVAA